MTVRRSEEAIAVAEIPSPMTLTSGYTRRQVSYDLFSGDLALLDSVNLFPIIHHVLLSTRCLDIDSSAWLGLEETANSSPAKHHIGAVWLFSQFDPLAF